MAADDWKSVNVAKGGMFNPPKVRYSKETHDLLKLLMEESKLTMLHRNNINYHLRNGEPLPLPTEQKEKKIDERLLALEQMRKKRIARRKTLEAIRASGAFDIPKYEPIEIKRKPVEQEKKHLQESMSGTKMITPEEEAKALRLRMKEAEPKQLSPTELIDKFLAQIQDRLDWLAKMEKLGQGKKYESLMHSQIAEKLRKIKILEKEEEAMLNGKEEKHRPNLENLRQTNEELINNKSRVSTEIF